MERWQCEYINKKLPKLIRYIGVHGTLLSYLISYGVISNADVAEINSIANCNDKVQKLIDILATRSNAYYSLMKALEKTQQTGAHKILLKGIPSNKSNHDAKTKLYEIETVWSSLEQPTRDYIYESEVLFMGRHIKLSTILSQIDPIDANNILQHALFGSTLKNLHDNPNNFILAKDFTPSELSYYVTRTISTRHYLDTTFFEKATDNDIVVIQGLSSSELTVLAKGRKTNVSKNRQRNISEQFYVLTDKMHFERLCRIKRSDQSVHWIVYKDGKFFWHKTMGNMALIRNCTSATDQQIHLQEKDIIGYLENKPRNEAVIISDSPGMGKSVLLGNIAKKLRNNDSNKNNKLVFFLDFASLVKELESMKSNFTLNTLLAHISKKYSETTFGHEILFQLLRLKTSVIELLLDGFDEIHTEQLDFAIDILKLVTKEWTNARLFITTRPNMRDILEDTFTQLAYNILPFQPNDQIDFMVKFWQNMWNVKDKEISKIVKLANFARECLNEVQVQITDFQKSIAGVPLQCLMLAQVNAENAKSYLEDTTVCIERAKIDSIFDMYKSLMEKLYERAFTMEQDKLKRENMFEKARNFLTCKKKLTDCIKHAHVSAAFRLLFPESAKDFEKFLNTYIKGITLEDMYSIGIIMPGTFNDEVPKFYHRTFAEYLIAEFLVETFKNSTSVCRSRETFMLFLFDKVLNVEPHQIQPFCSSELPDVDQTCIDSWKFKNPVLCYFLDSHIEVKKFTTANWTFFNSCLKSTKFDDSNNFYKRAVSSAYQDFTFIFELCQNAFLDIDQKSTQFNRFRVPPTETFRVLFWTIRRWTTQPNWDEILQIAALCASERFFDMSRSLVDSIRRSTPHQPRPMIAYSPLRRASSVRKKENSSTPIQLAVKKGNYRIVANIWNDNPSSFRDTRCLLHICVADSLNDTEGILCGKEEIIKLVLKGFKHALDEVHPVTECTPLLMKNINIRLIKCLINQGANVFVSTKNGNDTIAHLALSYLSPKDYLDLINFLIQKGFKEILSEANNMGVSPTLLLCTNQDIRCLLIEKRFTSDYPELASHITNSFGLSTNNQRVSFCETTYL